MFKSFLVLNLIFCAVLSHAQQPQVPALTFQAWKEQQILDAQNQVLRISARLSQLKSSSKNEANNAKESSSPLPGGRIKKSESDTLAATEKELRRAQESLRGANDSSLEEYALVYIPTLREHPEALQGLAQKLSKEELAEIFKVLVLKDGPSDTKRNNPSLVGTLSASARSNP